MFGGCSVEALGCIKQHDAHLDRLGNARKTIPICWRCWRRNREGTVIWCGTDLDDSAQRLTTAADDSAALFAE
ncbi:MAG: hypothetical protein ACJ8AI_06985 [Rhodopila sp.]